MPAEASTADQRSQYPAQRHAYLLRYPRYDRRASVTSRKARTPVDLTITAERAKIYKMIDPLPSDLVYIGRTIRPLEARRRQHVTHCHHGMTAQAPIYAWIRSLLKAGREPVIVELEDVAASQAVAAEDRWIAHYRASGATVLNLRSGASGNAKRHLHQQTFFDLPYRSESGYRGVTRSGKTKWRALMRHRGIYQNLGTYETAEEAARAYDQAAIALFGPAAFLNFPDEQ